MYIVWTYLFSIIEVNDGIIRLKTDDHLFSSWDGVNNRPECSCYTQSLFRAMMINNTPSDSVAIMGLGGGILPARLARMGIRSHVFEISREIISTYHTVFEPLLVKWSPNVHTHVTIEQADALNSEYTEFSSVVVDIPLCYRDISVSCVAVLKRLRKYNKKLFVNVWYYNAPMLLFNMGGSIVEQSDNGVLVWSS
jgi:hypothetical protein